MYGVLYNNRYNTKYIYNVSNCFNKNNNLENQNLHCNNNNEDEVTIINNKIDISIIDSFSLNDILINNNFNIYNSIYVYKFNTLLLLKNTNSSFGFVEFKIPTFNKNTSNLYILLNINIDNKYSENVKLIDNDGNITNFDLKTKKFFLESKYENGSSELINKKFTLSFTSDLLIIKELNIYFLGNLSNDENTEIENSSKQDELLITKENNTIMSFENDKNTYNKKYVYINLFDSIDKLKYTNIFKPTILMNNGLWGQIINKSNLFSISSKVPIFIDIGYEYYIELEYYITKGGCLDLKIFNDKKLYSNSISQNISNSNGIIIKKLDDMQNPFLSYLIYGVNCEDVVLKNMQIFYFIKDIDNIECNNNESECNNNESECNNNESECKIIKSITAIGDGITVESGGQLIVGS